MSLIVQVLSAAVADILDQRQIGSLASKKATYERLLKDIVSRVGEEDRILIEKTLEKVRPLITNAIQTCI